MTRASPRNPVYCRVTVLAPRSRVDVALPTDVPVAELVPMVLELVGEPVPWHRPVPWRLSGPAGGILPAAATLGELGVLDGELLRIGPVAPAPAAPVYDDPVDALAASGAGGPAADERRFWTVITLVVALAAAVLLAGFRGLSPDPEVPTALVVLAVALGATGSIVAVVRAARLGPDRLAALTAAMTAVPLAAAAGWAALPGAPGAAHVLLAAAAAGTAAAVAQVAVRVIAPVLVGVVVVAVALGVGALLRLRFGISPGALAAGAGALALAAGPVLPRAALRLAGLPPPLVPGDAHELVAADTGPDLLPPAEFAERADLARGYLAGLVGGCAAVSVAAVVPAASTGSWTGPAFAVVATAVLGLRSRGYADRAPARMLQVAAIGAGLGLAGLLTVEGGPAGRLVAVLVLVIGAVTGAVAARPGGGTGHRSSPVSRRAVDLLEGLLMAAAIPLALGAMGAYELVRGL